MQAAVSLMGRTTCAAVGLIVGLTGYRVGVGEYGQTALHT